VTIEHRWAEGRNDRLPALAAELVRRQVTVIVSTGSTAATIAAKAATSTIPIVFYGGADPVEVGFAASLSRPGGNLTGVVSLNVEVGAKRLELLHELVPAATIIAMLVDPLVEVGQSREDMQAAARTLGVELHILRTSTERDITMAFATLAELRAGALVIGGGSFLLGRIEMLTALTLRHAVPSISQDRDLTAAGGLLSYGGDLAESYHLAGVYAGRILKGEKPSDLPVQQATKVELILNLKTAKLLGITVPITLLGRADEVIE
jgi:putative ABC transport system substrate-binding protein